MSLALSLRKVTKTYATGVAGCRASVRALDGVDLDVAPGELVQLLGARGSGKTTLLLCAAGLVAPDHGAVTWPATAAPGYAAYAMAARESLGADREPGLLLVDSSGAEAPASRWALDEWLGPVRERGVAVLVASRVRLLATATRVVVLSAGRLVRDVSVSGAMPARVAERSIDSLSGRA